MIQTLQSDTATICGKSVIKCLEVWTKAGDYKPQLRNHLSINDVEYLNLLAETDVLGLKQYKMSLKELATLGRLVRYAKDFKHLPEDYCVEVV